MMVVSRQLANEKGFVSDLSWKPYNLLSPNSKYRDYKLKFIINFTIVKFFFFWGGTTTWEVIL